MTCPYDASLSPTLPITLVPLPGCRQFDFTIAFEDVVFSVVPSIVAIPVAAVSICRAASQPVLQDWNLVRVAKLTFGAALAALQLAQICLFASTVQSAATRFTLPALVLVLLSVSTISVLSVVEYSRSRRPSFVVQLYLSLSLLPDAARVRTTWLVTETSPLSALQTTALAIKFSFLLLESMPKNSQVRTEAVQSLEETAGLFSRSLLLWLNSLFLRGYRHKLTVDDLPPLDDQLTSARLTEALNESWRKTHPARRRRLALSLIRIFVRQLLLVQLPRLALVGFALSQPLLLEATLDYVRDHSILAVPRGQALVGAFALSYMAVAVSTVWYQHLTFRLLTMIRGALIGMIFKHSLMLPLSTLGKGTEAVSLMSTDMERITQTLQWVLNIIPDIIQVASALYILQQRLGSVFVAPIIVSVLCAMAAAELGKRIPPRQRRWMQAIQKRVGVTSGVISSIKSIKFSGLTDVVTQDIQDSRVAEIKDQKSFRHLQVIMIALGNTPAMITPAVTLCAFAIAQLLSGGQQFQAVTAFTSLSLLVIMINPIAELVTAVTNLASALSCLDRIQEFLQKEPLKSTPHLGLPLCENDGVGPGTDLARTEMTHEPAISTSISLAQFEPPRPENIASPLIRVVGGVFGYEDDKAILKDINIQVYPSSLLLVVGPVGSGKSTLLRSLLGETRIIAGTLECVAPKQFAYCDQEPWILNTSIKQNILGVNAYDGERYQRVLDACQLRRDLDELPMGDETMAGSKGMSLSGGQKARIGMARAAYSRKDIVIVDDCLGALDPMTAASCFRALFGPSGMFKDEGRTVVFATHDLQWIPSSDHIVVLNGDGHVNSSGNWRSVTETSAYLIELAEERRKEGQKRLDNTTTQDENIAPTTEAPVVSLTLIPPTKKNDQESDVAANPPGISALRYYVLLMDKGALLVFASLVVLHIGSSTAQPLWLKYWAASNERDPGSAVGQWIGVYVACAVATIMFIGLQTGFFFIIIAPKLATNLHRRLLDATMWAPLSFFVTHSNGVIINLFTGDLNLADLRLPGGFLLTSEKVALVIAEVILTCLASGYLALSIPLLAIALYILQRVYLASSRRLRVLDLELKAPLFNSLLDAASGLATIRAYSWNAETERLNTKLLDASQQPHYLLFCLQRWLTLVLDLVTAGLATLIVGLGVILRDTIDPGFLGVALVSVMSFGNIVGALIMQWTNLETSLGAVRRIADFVDFAADDGEGAGSTGANLTADAGWPAAGSVTFSDVAASYGSRRVLDEVNITFPVGGKTAVCGRTGSGKSTLLGLIMRLSPIDRGTIHLDGVEISQVPHRKLQEAVAGLPQDPVLLHGSVRHNLDPSGMYVESDEALLQALQKVGLADLIGEKGGLDAQLNADWFSTGQRQLFCLARVMLRRCRVLLLDEATSYLDRQSEKLVYTLLQTEFRDCTVIAVTHHLRFKEASGWVFDQVVVLDDGKVAESGSPATLINSSGSLFDQLVQTQWSPSS